MAQVEKREGVRITCPPDGVPRAPPMNAAPCTPVYEWNSMLSLHHNHWLQPCHQLRQPCIMHHIHHLLRVLVSLGSLLGQKVLAVYAHCDTPGIQLVEQVLTVQRLLGGGTTLAASGTVAGCTESLL